MTFSDAAQAALSNGTQTDSVQALGSIDDAVEDDPKMRLLKLLIEFMTGKKISLIHATDLASSSESASTEAVAATASATAQQAEPAGYGIEYDYHTSYSESAFLSFDASGIIKTADGQEIRFDVSLTMQHRYSEETTIRIREGIRFIQGGGFLALDRNNDGNITMDRNCSGRTPATALPNSKPWTAMATTGLMKRMRCISN